MFYHPKSKTACISSALASVRWLLLLREAVEAQVSVLTAQTGSEVGSGKTARVSPQLDCWGRRAEQMGIVSRLSVSVSGRVTLAGLDKQHR